MSVYIFTGPTICAADAAAELKAIYLPPAAEGDVYRVAQWRPKAIGIIDGYFQSRPAVRHKEILWALSRGIHLFGCASIGALRAAELAAFGMEGVGKVFEMFRDGILEDDDEVAIVHGPAEVGFLAGSEAMVNIRQTLAKAELLGVISRNLRANLVNIAKGLFYPDRNYSVLIQSAVEQGVSEQKLAQLNKWLSQNRVNQKREDAIAMLRLIRRRIRQGLKPKTVSYSFEHTAMWESASRQCGELRFGSGDDPVIIVLESLLDELRLQGRYKHHSFLALGRLLAIRETERLGMNVSRERGTNAEIAFRREHGLSDALSLDRWMHDNRLDQNQFDSLMSDQARVNWFVECAELLSQSRLLEHLRLSGDYPRLVARADAKIRLLDSVACKNPGLESVALTERQLFTWYFEVLLDRPVPEDVDAYAFEIGFGSIHTFRRALVKEYLYRHFSENDTTASDQMGSEPRQAFRNADPSGADQTLDPAEAARE